MSCVCMTGGDRADSGGGAGHPRDYLAVNPDHLIPTSR